MLLIFIINIGIFYRSPDSLVGIATSYGLDDQGVGVRVSLLHGYDRLWGPPMGTGGSLPWGNAAGA
jgi:hypothetical protein